MKMLDGTNKKVIAYYPLHYGVEWLAWSMRSIASIVDEIIVVYTSQPSYGHNTKQPCPESKEDVMSVASEYIPSSNWYEGKFKTESAHRQHARNLCKIHGADIIMAIDADEIWGQQHLINALNYVNDGNAERYRVPMQHYWRSIKKVCRDAALPERFMRVNYYPPMNRERVAYDNIPYYMGYVHHFGYAQSPRMMKYKWQIHGHKNELRAGWLENKFMANASLDVHPTNVDFWTVAAADTEPLESLLSDHPYWGLDLIDDSIVCGEVVHQTKSIQPFILSEAPNV